MVEWYNASYVLSADEDCHYGTLQPTDTLLEIDDGDILFFNSALCKILNV